jgi:hypothetical protein
MIRSRRMRWARHVACMGYKRNACRVLVGNPERNMPPEKPRHRQSYDVKTHLTEIGWESVEWICLVRDRDKSRAV